jgi:hypothetical protein
MDDGLDRFDKSRQRYPFLPRVEQHPSRKDVWGWIPHSTQATTIGATSNRLAAYGDTGILDSKLRPRDHLRMLIQHRSHILVLVDMRYLRAQTRSLPFELSRDVSHFVESFQISRMIEISND